MSKYEFETGIKNTYVAFNWECRTEVTVNEDSKISVIHLKKRGITDSDGYILSAAVEKNRSSKDEDFSMFLGEVFETMMNCNVDEFNLMLHRIKDSEPDYFIIGFKMLERKRDKLLEEADKYSFT